MLILNSPTEDIRTYLINNGINKDIIFLNGFMDNLKRIIHLKQYNGKKNLNDETEDIYIQILIKDNSYKETYNLLKTVRDLLNVKEFIIENNRYFLIQEISINELDKNLYSLNIKLYKEEIKEI